MASPVFFIKKKDGLLWLVQDYWALNSVTVKNCYLIPLISELIMQLQGAKYFTKLDVRWGFNKVQIWEVDEWKAAFRTNWGLFEPQVMFFGLTNSLATFQTMMNDIFCDMIAEGVVCVYLDNILIFTKTLSEHQTITQRVLECLWEYNLCLKLEKCKFKCTQIEYLRVIVLEGMVEMDLVKVSGVSEWPEPRNKREVQSFVRFINFYRWFIKDFPHHVHTLFDLTKKDVRWCWGASEQASFNKLKELITSALVLVFPNNSLSYCIEADSSNTATRAVLSQQTSLEDGGKWHPIAFFSKSLSPVERNYEIHDKEMLAIIRALEEWQHFLEGTSCQFEIWTDHKNLEYFCMSKKLNQRQAQWSLHLSWFNFTFHHHPGSSMGKSDALSQYSNHRSGSGDCCDKQRKTIMNHYYHTYKEGKES